MSQILVTKKLNKAHHKLLDEAGLEVTEYNAINITYLPFQAPAQIGLAIFSSQNAVKAVFEVSHNKPTISKVFCVGEKTKHLLEKKGQHVVKCAPYASKLADFIKKNLENGPIYFFTGTLRREEIPAALKKAKIDCFEIKTYQNTPNPIHFDQKFDGVLFFSPSGVRSFISRNSLYDTIAICIGKTTASEAKKYGKNVICAEETHIESVIEKTISAFSETKENQ